MLCKTKLLQLTNRVVAAANICMGVYTAKKFSEHNRVKKKKKLRNENTRNKFNKYTYGPLLAPATGLSLPSVKALSFNCSNALLAASCFAAFFWRPLPVAKREEMKRS